MISAIDIRDMIEDASEESSTHREMVRDFHKAFGLHYEGFPSLEEQALRKSLNHEERKELLKEIIDYAYVLLGEDVTYADNANRYKVASLKLFARGLGMDFDGAFKEVHKSNMSKLWEGGEVRKRTDGKVLKPDTYITPDMAPYV